MLLLLISTLIKMVFVLTILATYSPVLVWAERRQSAMLQDRIGPVKGGFALPPHWQLLAAIGGGQTFGLFATHASIVLLLVLFWDLPLTGHIWAFVPVIGPFVELGSTSGFWSFLCVLSGLGQIAGVAMAGTAYGAKMGLADFIRGPVTWGAWKVALLGAWVSLSSAVMVGLHAYAPETPLAILFVQTLLVETALVVLVSGFVVVSSAFEKSAAEGALSLLVPFYGVYYALAKLEHPRKLLIAAALGTGMLLLLVEIPIEILYANALAAVQAAEAARQAGLQVPEVAPLYSTIVSWPAVAPAGSDVGLLWLTTRELRWLIVLGAIVAALHVVAARFVRGAVNKDNVLTAYGLIHPLADVVKMLWKEDFAPPRADKFLFTIAPIIAMVPAFATAAVVPFGPDLWWGPDGDMFGNLWSVMPPDGAPIIGSTLIPLQVARVNVGVLYMFAIAGTGIVGAAIAGYSSDNKFSLLGGLRAASQMVSYEVTLGLTLVGCFMVYDTLLLEDMVSWQQQHMWGFLVQPLGLVLFFFASIAEMKRVPFDAPEGESEIVAGYFLEYSGMKFGMFMAGEFIEHVTSSALIVTLFFGGYDVPFLRVDGIHIDWLDFYAPMPHLAVVLTCVLAFLIKVAICCFLQMQVRWTLPRLRYDQTMQLCWKIILPLSLANIFVTGLVLLLLHQG